MTLAELPQNFIKLHTQHQHQINSNIYCLCLFISRCDVVPQTGPATKNLLNTLHFWFTFKITF